MSLDKNKTLVNKQSEFYNRSTNSWLQDNDTKMYSTHNEGKSVVSKKIIRTAKNKTYEYMTSVSKNVYIDKLDDIGKKKNQSNHRTIIMEPVNQKSSRYIHFGSENIDK